MCVHVHVCTCVYMFMCVQVLKKTTEQADKNIEAVERETGRLRKHTSGCGCGIWLLLLIVFTVFIAMVVFIRIVPKPTH